MSELSFIFNEYLSVRTCYLENPLQGLMHGQAGYVYALLALREKLQDAKMIATIDKSIVAVVQRIFEVCGERGEPLNQYCTEDYYKRKIAKEKLKCFWHLRVLFDGEFCVGAADGLSGVLYVLLRAVRTIPKLHENTKMMEVLEETVFRLYKDIQKNLFVESYKETSNFVKGISGSIPMLCAASEAFPSCSKSLLTAATRAGELLWRVGFNLPGTGLANGLSGHGYLLHSLYRLFKKQEVTNEKAELQEAKKEKAELWRQRAFQLAKSVSRRDYLKRHDQLATLAEVDRHTGHSDKTLTTHPYSLMEGISGDICFLSDLLRDDEAVRFPGYEL